MIAVNVWGGSDTACTGPGTVRLDFFWPDLSSNLPQISFCSVLPPQCIYLGPNFLVELHHQNMIKGLQTSMNSVYMQLLCVSIIFLWEEHTELGLLFYSIYDRKCIFECVHEIHDAGMPDKLFIPKICQTLTLNTFQLNVTWLQNYC